MNNPTMTRGRPPRPRSLLFRCALVCYVFSTVVGCGKAAAPLAPYEMEEAGAYGGAPASASIQSVPGAAADSMAYAEGLATSTAGTPRRSTPAPAPSMPGGKGGNAIPPPPPPPDPNKPVDPNQPKAVAQARRMVYYNGYAKLRATDLEDTLDAAVRMATEAGGFVEKLTPSMVIVRVPVDRFREIFPELLKLGDVLAKSISADDVTDAFRAADLRLRTATETRDRLQALLAQARTEQEKLQLLRQIQRVTAEIDQLTAMLETLRSLASYSRITLEVVAREAITSRAWQSEPMPFRWIPALSPFNRAVAEQGDLLTLEVPEGMVPLDEKKHWVVESADGARMWSSRHHKKVQGDTAFWMEAIRLRLGPEFRDVSVTEGGGFQVLRLVDRADTPYTYLVAVRVEDGDLDLVEAYFPTADHERRYGKAVMAAITKGEL